MKVKRDILENELRITLQSEFLAKRKMKEKIIESFKQRGFTYGRISEILAGINPLEQVSDELLWLLCYILYQDIDDSNTKTKIEPSKFLTDVELDIVKNLIANEKEESIYPLVIENVNCDIDEDYTTVFNMEKISEYFDKRIFKYNFETQRPLITKFFNGIEVKRIDINKKSKEQIKKNIVNGIQVPNVITLNLLADGKENFIYENGSLIITSGELDVIDGWHRITAGREAYKSIIGTDNNFYFKVRIVHWDAERAKAFIHQESLGNKLDITATKKLNVYSNYNLVINKLNENPKCALHNLISTNINDRNKLVSFDLFFDTLKMLFTIKNQSENFTVSNHLKDCINLIVENNLDMLKEQQQDIVWVAYLTIIAEYYQSEDEEWKMKFINSIEKLNIEDLKQQTFPKKITNKFIISVKDYLRKEGVLNV